MKLFQQLKLVKLRIVSSLYWNNVENQSCTARARGRWICYPSSDWHFQMMIFEMIKQRSLSIHWLDDKKWTIYFFSLHGRSSSLMFIQHVIIRINGEGIFKFERKIFSHLMRYLQIALLMMNETFTCSDWLTWWILFINCLVIIHWWSWLLLSTKCAL